MTGNTARRRTWSFWKKWRGLYLRRNGQLGENRAGAMCVNVPNTFWAGLGIGSVGGNAADFLEFHDDVRLWLRAAPSLRLEHGDTVVFKPSIVGPDGHVDLVLDGSRQPWAGADQNWPLGHPVSEVWHTMEQVAGVIRVRWHLL